MKMSGKGKDEKKDREHFRESERMGGTRHGGLAFPEKRTGVYVFEKVADAEVNNYELRVGDIIVEFDGKPVSSVDDMHKLFSHEVIGNRKKAGVLREGHKRDIYIVPGELK